MNIKVTVFAESERFYYTKPAFNVWSLPPIVLGVSVFCLCFGIYYFHLSYDVVSESEITPCNKIDKPLVVYRFTGNVMTSIRTLRT